MRGSVHAKRFSDLEPKSINGSESLNWATTSEPMRPCSEARIGSRKLTMLEGTAEANNRNAEEGSGSHWPIASGAGPGVSRT